MKAIRNQYSEEGVEAYYRQHGGEYRNPHFPQIRTLLHQNECRIDYTQSLDFCCGSGEVSLVLRELGYPPPLASDPFTGAAYHRRFNRPCLSLSFEDVVRNGLEPYGPFSAIICSFAMHLCPRDLLFPIAYRLLQRTAQLIIITPHKRPVLERYEGISLDFTDFALTERGKKVSLKGYSF